MRIQGNIRSVWTNPNNSITVSLPSPPTPGNTLIAVFGSGNWGTPYTSVASISQSGVTWTKIVSSINGGIESEIWIGDVVQSPSATAVVNLSSVSSLSAAVVNLSEYDNISAIDKIASAIGGGTGNPNYTSTGRTEVTTAANELWIGAIWAYGTGQGPQTAPINGFIDLDGADTGHGSLAMLEKTTQQNGTAESGTTSPSVWNGYAGCIATLILEGGTSLQANITPATAEISINQAIPLTCNISGGSGNYAYQWYINDVDTGITTKTYSFIQQQPGVYTVYATVNDGTGTIITNSATINVIITMYPLTTGNGKILQNGQPFRLIGIGKIGELISSTGMWTNPNNLPIAAFSLQFQPLDIANVDATLSVFQNYWHANMIRLMIPVNWYWLDQLSYSYDNGWIPTGGPTVSYRNYIKTICIEAAKYGIYVDIAPWCIVSGYETGDFGTHGIPGAFDSNAAVQSFLNSVKATYGTELAFWNAFWAQMATDLGGLTNVIFEAWNEPDDNTTGAIPASYMSYLTAMYNGVRAHSQNLIFMQWHYGVIPNYIDFSWTSQLTSFTNVVAVGHVYRHAPYFVTNWSANPVTAASQLRALIATSRLPVIFNELGVLSIASLYTPTAPLSDELSFFTGICQELRDEGLGACIHFWLSDADGITPIYSNESVLSGTGQQPNQAGRIWLDYYIGASANYNLTVTSTPILTTIDVDSELANTPATLSLPTGPHTVTVPSSITDGTTIYNFQKWEDGSTETTRTINLVASTSIMAYFTPAPIPKIALTIAAEPASVGNLTPSAGEYEFNVGDFVQITATPIGDYKFSHWTLGTYNFNTNPLQLSIAQNMDNLTLTAYFYLPTVELNLPADVMQTPQGPLIIGKTYQFVAIVPTGYSLDHWTLDDVNKGSTNPLQLTITEDMNGKTLTAIFSEIKPPTITLNLAVSGSGTTSPASGEFNIGDIVQFVATPAEGQQFVRWNLNGVIFTDNPLNLPITTNLDGATLTAEFADTTSPTPNVAPIVILAVAAALALA